MMLHTVVRRGVIAGVSATLLLSSLMSTGAVAKKTRVTAMIAIFDGLTAKLLNEITEDYEAKNPNVDIVMNATSWLGETGWVEKLTTLAAAGSLPDVFYTRSAIIPWFSGSRGIMEPLDKYMTSSQMDTKQWPASALSAGSFLGTQYGLPYTAEVQWVFYNRDIMAQAGLPDLEAVYSNKTWNFETLAAYADKATRMKGPKVDIPGLDISISGYQSVGWAWGYGGDIWSEAQNQCKMDAPRAMDAWRFLYNLAFSRKALYAVDMPGDIYFSWDSILKGKFGMHVWLDGFIGVWESNRISWKYNMVPFPAGPVSNENILVSPELISVSKASKNKKEAFSFARYLCSDDALRHLVSKHGSFSTKRTMAALWAKSQVDKGRSGARFTQESLERSRPFPKLVRYSKAEEAMRPYWNNAWTRKTDLGQAMSQGAKEANKWLSRK